MPHISRRRFLSGSSAAFVSLALPAAARTPRRRGPSEEIRAAVIGLNGRGQNHVEELRALEGVRVVALCDVDELVLARALKPFAERGEKVDGHADARRVYDREDVDVVCIATPNHWHALGTIWACQAGKDVYVEKPVSHDLWEGRQMVAAARKYGRIVQAGTQCRSSEGIADAIAWLRAGNLGAIEVARGFCYKARKSIGKVSGPQPIPAQVDYELWCGPAPLVPLWRKSLHYDWHWVFDTGNGDLGNQGVHQVDLCRWALGASTLPKRVMSLGGRFGYADDGNTPNTQIFVCDYEEAPLVFEVRGLPPDKAAQASAWDNAHMDRYKGVSIGCVIECADGWLEIPNYDSARAFDASGALVQEWSGASSHFANFIAAVRARDASLLKSEVAEGHLSAALCHAGNASYRLGAASPVEETRARLKDDALAAEVFERVSAHLAANEVDLARERFAVGPWLELDPEHERCTSHVEANWLLASQYRPPFVVPAEV